MAPTYTTASTKYGIHRLDGSTQVLDVDAAVNQVVDDIDSRMAGYAEGTLSARSGVVATAGKLYRTTDTGQVFMGTGSAWIEIGVSPWTPGDLKWSWLTADHAGWLLCDGRTVSRTTYAALFAAIGVSISSGDGSTTFGIPDVRGRVLIAPDGAAGRLSVGLDARGGSGGEETHTLSEAEIPVHDHGTYGEQGSFAAGGTAIVVYDVVGGGTSPELRLSDTAGGGGAHGNMQPYLVAGGVFIRTT